MKYRVVVSIRTVETWEIDAEDEAEARELWEEGLLLLTAGYEMDRILWVEEIHEAQKGKP